MRLFAIADLHLSFRDGVPIKPMDRFGGHWEMHHERIAADWKKRVTDHDLVLLPGDLSWATRPSEAAEDLQWIASLPGHKVILKGNHDYWMPSSRKKLRDLLPPSVRCVQNDSIRVGDVVIVGSRLWDVPGLAFDSDAPAESLGSEEGMPAGDKDPEQDEKLLARELHRLKLSLDHAQEHQPPSCPVVAMTHFPPIDFKGHDSEAATILIEAGVTATAFGHLHGVVRAPQPVTLQGVDFYCVAADFLDFRLREIPIS